MVLDASHHLHETQSYANTGYLRVCLSVDFYYMVSIRCVSSWYSLVRQAKFGQTWFGLALQLWQWLGQDKWEQNFMMDHAGICYIFSHTHMQGI